jgi:hypothetical protein
MCCIIAVNIYIFLRIFLKVRAMARKTKRRSDFMRSLGVASIKSKVWTELSKIRTFMRETRHALKVGISFLSLLGVTWLFGVLAVDKAAVTFQYMFAICNTLQGVFIFVFHCLMDPSVKGAYQSWFSGKPRRIISGRTRKASIMPKETPSVSVGSTPNTMTSSSGKKSKKTSVMPRSSSDELALRRATFSSPATTGTGSNMSLQVPVKRGSQYSIQAPKQPNAALPYYSADASVDSSSESQPERRHVAYDFPAEVQSPTVQSITSRKLIIPDELRSPFEKQSDEAWMAENRVFLNLVDIETDRDEIDDLVDSFRSFEAPEGYLAHAYYK